jgi:hypothetical protein
MLFPPRGNLLESWSRVILDLSFGLPPLGRVPGFGMKISDLKAQ